MRVRAFIVQGVPVLLDGKKIGYACRDAIADDAHAEYWLVETAIDSGELILPISYSVSPVPY